MNEFLLSTRHRLCTCSHHHDQNNPKTNIFFLLPIALYAQPCAPRTRDTQEHTETRCRGCKMTVVVSHSPSDTLPPSTPPHVHLPEDPQAARLSLLESILSARRIVVVLGAGISTACGIPDFRSANGLFASPAAGKDLFDAHLFSDSTGSSQSRYYKMIASLRQSADAAPPSPFHRLLKRLDDQGKLCRVYTQNIDGLEHKAGLSYGLTLDSVPPVTKKQPSAKQCRARTPRVVPLHGNTLSLVCSRCSFRQDLALHLPLLASGQTAECVECVQMNKKRAEMRERSRGIGLMLPDVLLYNDHHHSDAATLGSILRADLTGPRPDLLLVVGTSLKVPGTKRLVRELSKFAQRRSQTNTDSTNDEENIDGDDSLSQRKGRSKKQKKFHTAFINSDWPIASSEWKDAFDVWYKGDCQSLVPLLDELSLQKEQVAEAKLKAKAAREAKARAKATFTSSSSCSSPLLPPTSSLASSSSSADYDFLPLPALSQSSSTSATTVSTISSQGSYAYDYYDPPSSLTSDIDDAPFPKVPFEVVITSPSKANHCSQALTQYFQTTKASPKKRSASSRKT